MKNKFVAVLATMALALTGLLVAAPASAVVNLSQGDDSSNPIILTSLDDVPEGAVSTGAFKRLCAAVQTWSLTTSGDELIEHPEYRYLREVPVVEEVSHLEYQWSIYSRTYNPGQQETFTWGTEERTRVQTDHSHQQYTYVKQVQTRTWVKDYVTEYQYQKQVQGTIQKQDGGWNNTGETFGWEWWVGNTTQWSPSDVAVLEFGSHNATQATWTDNGDQYRKQTTAYQYVKNGQTRQVEVGGHWSVWSVWSNYEPIAPVVTTTPQASIDGHPLSVAFHFGDSNYTEQYQWVLGSQDTIPDLPTFSDWTPWAVTATDLPAAPVLPSNTATHEYRATGPTGHGDAIAPSFSAWVTSFTPWQTSVTPPADPDGNAGEDNVLNLLKIGEGGPGVREQKVITTAYVPGYTEYYVAGGEPSLIEAEATWELGSPGEGWTEFDSRMVTDQVATPDVVTYYKWSDGVQCLVPGELEETEVLGGGETVVPPPVIVPAGAAVPAAASPRFAG